MEEAINTVVDPAILALDEAMKPGGELAPAALLTVMNADPNPTSTIDHMDRAYRHFEAVNQEFGFLHMCRKAKEAPATADQDRLVALMRWLIREFSDWSPAKDPERRKLACFFVVTGYCGENEGFWPGFAQVIKVNPALIDELGRRIAAMRSQPAASALSRSPISDDQIIGRFNAADAAGDWASIASEWPRFGHLLFPDYFLSQSVQYLHVFAPVTLRQAMDQLRQMVPVMLVLLAINVRQALELGEASANPYAQFGAVLRLLQSQRRSRNDIEPDEVEALVRLFMRIAANDTQWQAWMQALNRYPVRFPQLQRALGTALARGPESAIGPYVGAISLTAMGVGRSQVAQCLRSFRLTAANSRQLELWKLAYERWSKWNFGKQDKTENLVKIGTCELDYAIVGYAAECMDSASRTQKCNDLVAELSALPILWHASGTDFRQSVYRILSHLQPYIYAQQIMAGDDWLIEGKQFFPFDPRTDRYNAMLCKITVP